MLLARRVLRATDAELFDKRVEEHDSYFIGADVFYIFDCITELQKYWFSDMMVCNFFCLTCPFLREQQSIAYVPIMYEKHIYETVSRIRHAAPVLMNIRTMNAATYIHAVKVEGRRTEYMYFPIRIDGANCRLVTSSAESYGTNLPTLSLSHRVHKTVLYFSVSFAVSYTGLLLPSF